MKSIIDSWRGNWHLLEECVIGCFKEGVKVGSRNGSEAFYDENFFLYQEDGMLNIAVMCVHSK